MLLSTAGNGHDAGALDRSERRDSLGQKLQLFDVDFQEYRNIFHTKPTDGAGCPDLVIVENGKHGGIDDSSIKPSPYKNWLDAENDKAINSELPPSAHPLTPEQKKFADEALRLTTAMLDKMKIDDFSFLKDELADLQKLFGSSHDSNNNPLTPQFLREVEASIDAQLRQMDVRIVTSEVTGQTYLGVKDPDSSPGSPKYQRFFDIGSGPDCSKFQFPPD